MSLATGVSSRSAGSRALCLHLVTIPPGTRGVPHVHNGHESAIYTVSGETEVWHGEGLRHRSVVKAGDFMYVPPGTPHLPVNRSDVMTVAVVARTDPQEQESVVPHDPAPAPVRPERLPRRQPVATCPEPLPRRPPLYPAASCQPGRRSAPPAPPPRLRVPHLLPSVPTGDARRCAQEGGRRAFRPAPRPPRPPRLPRPRRSRPETLSWIVTSHRGRNDPRNADGFRRGTAEVAEAGGAGRERVGRVSGQRRRRARAAGEGRGAGGGLAGEGLGGRAGADQVAVAVGLVDPAHRRPVLGAAVATPAGYAASSCG